MTPYEDERRTLDGRWVQAQDVRAGDVVFGRGGRQVEVLAVFSWEGTAEVCCLSVDGHPNFAVGADGLLARNICFRHVIAKVTNVPVPQALIDLAARRSAETGKQYGVHGHHIVIQGVAENYSRLDDAAKANLTASQALMGRWKLGLLKTEQEAADQWAEKGRLYNLTYAVNHIDDIHGPAYVNKVWEILKGGQDEAFKFLKDNVSGKAFTEFERQIASKKTVDQALAAAVRIDRLNAAVVAQIKNTMQTKIDAVFDYMHGEFLGGGRFW